MKKALLALAITLSTTCALRLPARAQALSDLRIGDDASKLAGLGAPVAIDKYKAYVVRKWQFSNGNELSVTLDTNNKIVYLESDWGGRAQETGCDLDRLQFGVTTLSDLRARFGSNGLGFKERGPVITIPDGIVMLNSYDAGTSVVTFFSKVATTSGKSPQDGDVAGRAQLDAISIASADYAKSEWGEKIYDPKYKKIEWK